MGQLTPRLRDAGAEVVAIAVTSTFSQRAFARSLGIDFPLLSDWSRQAAAAFGVQYASWKHHDGVAKRSVFVLDRDGIVRLRWVTDDAHDLPDLDALVNVVAGIENP